MINPKMYNLSNLELTEEEVFELHILVNTIVSNIGLSERLSKILFGLLEKLNAIRNPLFTHDGEP